MKVAVVGAGPAGSLLSYHLARDGAAVTAFDASHPREKPCGGGLTARALALLPPAPADDPLPARRVERCCFDSGQGESVSVALGRPVAIVARRDFDAWLLRRAVRAGARHVAERVAELDASGRLRTSTGRALRFDLLVGADGAGSLVRRTLLRPTPPARLVIATGWYAPGTVAMTLRFLPGLAGYAWLFPRPDHVAVGICAPLGSQPTARLLQRLEREAALDFPALSPDPEAGRYAHTIPSPSTAPASLRELAGPGWALVGDAAALADPLTGEGIFYALRSAELLSECLRAEGSPLRYPQRLLEECGPELLEAARLRGRFYAPGFARRMVRYASWSPGLARVLGELVLGEQGYEGLKPRLLAELPRFAWEAARARVMQLA